MSSPPPLRLGVIGLGVGRFHANTFGGLPGFRVAAMADRSPSRLPVGFEEFCAHHGAVPYTDALTMLEREPLDVVSICTSPASHRELATAAAERDAHVILEKPMAGSLGDCEAIQAACDRAGVQLHVSFPMRALPPVERLHERLRRGDLGTPFLVSAEYVMGVRPPGHWVWREGAGSSPLNENTCHTLDLLRFLLGDVVRARAEGGNYLGASELPDAAAFTLRFAFGAIASVVGGAVGVDAFGFAPRLSVYGTDGQAELTGAAHTYTTVTWANRADTEPARERLVDDPLPPSAVPAYEPYPLLEPGLRRVAAALRDGASPLATGADGREAVRIALALIESARSGQTIDIASRQKAKL